MCFHQRQECLLRDHGVFTYPLGSLLLGETETEDSSKSLQAFATESPLIGHPHVLRHPDTKGGPREDHTAL